MSGRGSPVAIACEQMASRLALALVTAAAATAAVGCGVTVTSQASQPVGGGGGGVSPDAGVPSVAGDAATDAGSAQTPHAFVEQFFDNDCAAAFTCASSFPGSQADFDDDFDDSLADCNSDVVALAQIVETEVGNGNVLFSAADAASCLATLVDGSCTTFWNNNGFPSGTSCDDVLTGTETKGEPCVTDFDCISPLACGTHGTCVTTD
jgi:hypothetical protein